MNTNKLHLFYAPITQKDDLIVKRKESYCNNEIREHIQAPEVTSLLLLMHTLGETKHQLEEFAENCSSYFLI